MALVKTFALATAAALLAAGIGVAQAGGSPRPESTDQSKVRGATGIVARDYGSNLATKSGPAGDGRAGTMASQGSDTAPLIPFHGTNPNAYMNENFEVGSRPGRY